MKLKIFPKLLLRTFSMTGDRHPAVLLAAFVFLLAPTRSHALGFLIPNQDAEAIGRGNAFIATANNPSAVYYNPAAITKLEGAQAQFGAHNLAINSYYDSLDGTRHAQTKSPIAMVPQFFYTISPKGSALSFGLGVYAPYGLAVDWGTNTPFRTLATKGKLTYITLNPVAAWEILPNLSIAAGPTINYSKVELRQGIGFLPGDSFSVTGNGWAFGATAGLLWEPFPKWSVGMNYRSPTTVNYQGRSHMRPYAPSESTSGKLDFAQSVGLGIGYRPTEHWSFEVYGSWADWDSLNTVTFKKNSGNVPFPLNWESSFMTGVGATRFFDNGWFVSAGYFFSQNSTSEKNFNPVLPDTDLHVGSVGLGYKGKHWSVALAGQLITGPDRVVNSSQSTSLVGESADGKYHWFNQSVNFSVGYHF